MCAESAVKQQVTVIQKSPCVVYSNSTLYRYYFAYYGSILQAFLPSEALNINNTAPSAPDDANVSTITVNLMAQSGKILTIQVRILSDFLQDQMKRSISDVQEMNLAFALSSQY